MRTARRAVTLLISMIAAGIAGGCGSDLTPKAPGRASDASAAAQPTGAASARAFADAPTVAPADAAPLARLQLPTGVFITPTAASGANFEPLNPDLPTRPDFTAGQAVATALSPDGSTLLVLTSGYNRNAGPDGKLIAAESNEYVFIYDTHGGSPLKKQVVQLPNTFNGIAWGPRSDRFYVTGGVDDNLHELVRGGAGSFTERAPAIKLGHTTGLGLATPPTAAGVAVDASGRRAVVANFENDSITVIDLVARAPSAELDLRPGKLDPARRGVAGGEYPFWVAISGDTAYVTSQRDRQVVAIDLGGKAPRVRARISVGDQPNKMLLDRSERHLYVANGNSDSVSVIDTASDRVIETFGTLAPRALFANRNRLRGANPNSLALSPDERTLYVSNGGTNSLAVIHLARRGGDDDGDSDSNSAEHSRVVGLVPTGWYPNSVSVSSDGRQLYVVNGKSVAGPNAGACRDSGALAPTSCAGTNRYVWQLTKAGLLTLPTPSDWSLLRLSWQVAENNHFPAAERHPFDQWIMSFLRSRIQHVVYIVKENRTYDQLFGDLPVGDGDPALTIFGSAVTPNHHALARKFVTLDRFYDSGEVSGDGWNWSVSARTTDQTEKTVAVNYAGRGVQYDWEGTNRNINVGLPDVASRVAFNPFSPTDPDLLPGTVDTAAADRGEDAGAGYLWDAALQAGVSVRNYGFFGDLARYPIPQSQPGAVPLDHDPAASATRVFFPTKASLVAISDPYYRGYDNKFPDYWRFREWEREFDAEQASDTFPALNLVRFMHDHFGEFGAAIDGVNTPELQMADNDYAVGLLVEKISKSRYADSTLIFVLEDDAQNGGDHVDAHRSVALVAGSYVKQGVVVSTPYDTVNVLRTIEDVLGLSPLGLTDGLARPMSDLFELRATAPDWRYAASASALLGTSALPLPAPIANAAQAERPRHDARWWERHMAGQDFSREDALDTARFNRVLWKGVNGDRRSAR